MKTTSRQSGFLQFILLLILAGVFLFVAWWIKSPSSPFRRGGELTPAQITEKINKGAKYLIEITDKGFIPSILRVAPYDTVTFLNRDTAEHWVVSGDSEGKGGCEGFDTTRPLIQYETYSIVFDKENVCPFFDKLSNVTGGEITIVETE